MNAMYTRLVNLIISRLVVVLTLLSIGAFLSTTRSPWVNSNINTEPLIVLAAAVGALSILYYTLLRGSQHYLAQAYLQLLVDAGLVTWLTYRLRDSDFPLVPLYLVIIFVSAMVLPRTGAIAIGVFCTLCYIGLLVFYKVGLLVGGYSIIQQDTRYLQNNPLLYVLAMLALTVLGGQLAERLRRNDADLESVAKNLAELRAFNQRIIESIKSGLVTTDLDGVITSFNRAAEDITGFRAGEVRGKSFVEVFESDAKTLPLNPKILENNNERFRRFESDCRSADDRLIRLGFTVSQLTAENGSVTGFVYSFQDLTEILKLEQEIRRQDRLAALGKMAAGIAHEIRNPLAAMRGSVQLLRSELELSDDHDSLMRIVLRESDRLNGIINDFLAYARPSPLRISPIDINSLVEETVTLLRHSPEVKPGHKIRVQADQPVLSMQADSNQIKQVIWNLSRNAIQAMPNSGELEIRLTQLPDKRVQIRLLDTGCGLSQTQLDQLFEPFSSEREGGTGLGMAIVYQIVQDHRGTIEVKNREDETGIKGAEIILTLPQLELPEQLPAESNPLPPQRRVTHRTPSGIQIPFDFLSAKSSR
jgi:two-component system sensor histidine kinase PilS (NtrC family)